MTYLIFAFRSRTQSIRFHGELKRRGEVAALINTPRDVSVGCGLSVKFDISAYETAVSVLRLLELNTFLGAFRVTVTGQRRRIERIFF